MTRRIVVVGHGMVGQRFLESCVARGLHESCSITIVGEEPRPAYDRVHLSSWFDGATEADLALAPGGWCAAHGIRTITGARVQVVDVAARHGAVGARMTGGGFGGAAIALLESDRVDAVADAVRARFAERGWMEPHAFVVHPSPGAGRIR